MKYFLIGLFFTVISTQGFSQHISSLNDGNNSNTISVTIKRQIEGKKSLPIDTIKKRIAEELKIELAQKVLSKVDVKSSSNSSQSNEIINNSGKKKADNKVVQKSNYYFISNIASSITLQNPKITVNYDEKSKTVTGNISIDKSEFTYLNYSLLKTKASNLISIIDASGADVIASSRVDQKIYNDIKQGNLDIKSLQELISVYNDTLIKSDPDLQTKLQKIDRAEYILLTKIESQDFQSHLHDIMVLQAQKQYIAALDQLKILIIDYPENQSLITTKKSILSDIESSYKNRLDNNDFLEIIKAIEELELIDNYFIQEYTERKSIIERRAFDQYIEKAESDFKEGRYEKASSNIIAISRYKQFDLSRYSNLVKKIGQELLKIEIKNADLKIDNLLYTDAYLILQQAKKYTSNIDDIKEISKREERVIDGITQQRIDEVKNKRPFSWQAQVGFSGLTSIQHAESFLFNSNQLTDLSQVYSFGIYKRLNNSTTLNSNNKLKRGANLLGLKLSIWSPGKVLKKNSQEYIPRALKVNTTIIEPQLSIFMLRFFELNIGKVVGNLTDSLNIKDLNNYYTLGLGIKPRFGNINFSGGIKCISDLKNNNYACLYMGMSIAVNFKRKFKHSEIGTIKSQVRGNLISSYDKASPNR